MLGRHVGRQPAGLRWLIACLLSVCAASAATRGWLYERDIAPILRTHCAGCHNEADREGEFSVETFTSLNRGGDKGATLKPGDPEGSLLVKLIEGRAKPVMPPKDEPRVSTAELALLRQWIAAVGGVVVGETPAYSEKRLKQLDYRQTLAEYARAEAERKAEAARRAAALAEAERRAQENSGWRE